MSCDKDNNEWDFIPVETADEIVFEDMTECKRLKNWKKWLKIRKQQNKLLGLKVNLFILLLIGTTSGVGR